MSGSQEAAVLHDMFRFETPDDFLTRIQGRRIGAKAFRVWQRISFCAHGWDFSLEDPIILDGAGFVQFLWNTDVGHVSVTIRCGAERPVWRGLWPKMKKRQSRKIVKEADHEGIPNQMLDALLLIGAAHMKCPPQEQDDDDIGGWCG